MAEEEPDVAALFAAKKKKKKPAKGEGEGEAGAGAGAEAAAGGGGGGGGVVVGGDPAPAATAAAPAAAPVFEPDDGDVEEAYEDMLHIMYGLLHDNNPELMGRCVLRGAAPPKNHLPLLKP